MSKPSAEILQELFKVIESRKGADPQGSYTAQLFDKGREKIARKFAEEALEVVLAGVNESPERLASESADALYHLLVLWADAGVDPGDVWAALENRQGTSGIEEKNGRDIQDV